MPPPVQCFSFNGHDKAEIVMWPEAKQACESQGAVLATIANPLEQGRSPPPPPAPLAGDLPGVVLKRLTHRLQLSSRPCCPTSPLTSGSASMTPRGNSSGWRASRCGT